MYRSAILMLAFLLIGAWPVDLSSYPPSPSGGKTNTERQSNTKTEHTGGQNAQSPATPRFSSQLLPDAPLHNEVGPQPEEHGYGYTNPDWWVAGGTIALVIVTGGLWRATWKLYKISATAVNDGENAIVTANAAVAAANRHVAEATRSAAAMERVATAMQDQVGEVRADRRAWLLVMAVSNYRLNANGGFDVDVTIQNFGRSPAINVLMTGFLTPTYSGILDIALARRGTDVDNTRYNNGFLVGPGEVIDQPVNLYNREVLSLGERNTVVDHATLKSGNYLLLGCITYGDPLNNEPTKPPYFTKFCFRPEGKARSGNPSDVICVALKKCHFFDSLQ